MERRVGQWENMIEGRSTLSSCDVGEEYWEYRGWRERQRYRSSRASNRSGHWSQGWQRLHFGHVVRAGGMEDDVMLGRMNGARKRGRPRQRWLDTLKWYASGASISNMIRDPRDRAGRRVSSYHGCRQGSDATRRHKVTRWCSHKCETINAWCRWCRLLLINITLKEIKILEYAFGEGEGVIKKRTLCTLS